jgi:protein-tyrosine phosphatase
VNTTFVPSPLTNLRDLGGIPVDGGTARTGVLFRADDVALVDAAGAEALVADGVTLVIDLRSPGEAERTGRGLLESHPVEYLHLPLTQEVADPRALSLYRTIAEADDPEFAMGSWYATLVRERAGDLVRGLEAVAEAESGVVFHCAAGKDRTGVFAASVLTVLGAEDEAIVLDYARTGDNLQALLARLAAATPEMAAAAASFEVPPVLMSAPAGSMRAMLQILESEDGGLKSVLREAGLTDETVARLRERLVV